MIELAKPALQTEGRTVTVLGSTPQVRRAFSTLANVDQIICVDFLPEMYDAASRYVDNAIVKREKFLCESWLHLSRAIETTDVVVGDKSIDNIAYEDWPRVFAEIRSVLSSSGRLILHVGLPDLTLGGRSFEELIQRWTDHYEQDRLPLDSAAAGLWEDLLSASADPTNRRLTLAPFVKSIHEHAHAHGKVALRLVELFESSFDDWWTRFDLDELVAVAANGGLRTENVRYCDDYLGAYMQPIISFA